MSGRVHVIEVTRDRRAAFAERVRGLERGVSYPLGDDRFEIDHGDDPFAFFDRLGEARYFAALDGDASNGGTSDDTVSGGDALLGGLAAVLRALPGGTEAWYLCDLKARAGVRGARVSVPLFETAVAALAPRCECAYGISMDPGDGGPNRVVRLIERAAAGRFEKAATLEFFTFDARAMARVEPLVREHRGDLGYLRLTGVKDIVLASTGAPMPLVHVQIGPFADGRASEPGPVPNGAHMLCAPTDDDLARGLRDAGHSPTARASIVQTGLQHEDWRWVLSSDV